MTLAIIRGAKDAPKSVRSKMETLLVSLAQVERWKLPPFQRPLRENDKVRSLAQALNSDGGCVSGVITLGRLSGDGDLYIVDGQHRIHAFKISSLQEAIMDVRICDFESLADMAEEFVRLNSAIVRMRPDDILRGMEGATLALRMIRKACPFVGYDQIRRNRESGPILSMSAVLRNWCGSANEVPATSGGQSALVLAQSLDAEDAGRLVKFLERGHAAWGRDPEYYRLWSALNLSICMWMWRRMVLGQGVTPGRRFTALKPDQFMKCMQSLSADAEYLSWLLGRQLTDTDRSPCYGRVKKIFSRRLIEEGIQNVKFPNAAWAS